LGLSQTRDVIAPVKQTQQEIGMQKKIMAVAVAGALAAPGLAFAQASTVQIYGTIVQHVNYVDRNGPATGSVAGTPAPITHDMQNTTDSEFGIRGEEALGGGLSAWFQCASSLSLNDGSTGNTLCGKNSGVGFKGGWGTAFVGLWDVPMKLAMAPLRPFSGTGTFGVAGLLWNGSAANVANGVAGGNTSQSASSWSRRQRNLISYWSPNWSGFEAKASVSNANEATAQTNATTAAKPRMWGVAGSYTNGPFYGAVGYERHKNYNPTANAVSYIGGNDHSWNAGAAYTFAGVFKLSFIYADAKWNTNVATALGNTNSLKQKSWALFGDWAITGPHRLRLGYVDARDTKGTLGATATGCGATTAAALAAARVTVGNYVANGGCGNTGSKLYEIQYAYAFSKRTEVNFGYVRINNDDNAVQP
jgi:predicted porin